MRVCVLQGTISPLFVTVSVPEQVEISICILLADHSSPLLYFYRPFPTLHSLPSLLSTVTQTVV